MGRDVGEVLTLSDRDPIGVVREWGVRKLGLQLELSTRAAIRKPVTVDLFPAYDEDGGLLVALTPRTPVGFGRLRLPWLDPQLAAEREHFAVLRIERRPGVQLATVALDRPACDDAPLPLLRQPLDAAGHPRQHRLAARAVLDGVGTGAVDRRPDDLGPYLRVRPTSSRRARPRGPRRGGHGSRARRPPAGCRRRSTPRSPVSPSPAILRGRPPAPPRGPGAAVGRGRARRDAPPRRVPRRRAAACGRRLRQARAGARAAAAGAASPRPCRRRPPARAGPRRSRRWRR